MTRPERTLHLAAILATLTLARGAWAQEPEPAVVRPVHTPPAIVSDSAPTDSAAPPKKPGCWRARPAPACEGFFHTDVAIEAPVYASRSPDDGRTRRDYGVRVAWGIGLMVNAGRNAHGVAAAITSDETRNGAAPLIVEYRFRRWLGESTLDAGLGFRRHPVPDGSGSLVRGRGITAMVGYTPNRWVGAQARVDRVSRAGRVHTGVLVGLQSTRVSEYMFYGLGIALRNAILGAIGIEWED